jgi:hypothetical protein
MMARRIDVFSAFRSAQDLPDEAPRFIAMAEQA